MTTQVLESQTGGADISTSRGNNDRPVAEGSLTNAGEIGAIDGTLREIERVLVRLETKTRIADQDDRNLGLLLRLTAAWLEGLDSEEIARALGWKISSLRRALHGGRKVQASQAPRVLLLSDIATQLGRTLERDAVGEWFRTEIPALKGRTPLEALQGHQGDRVLSVVNEYLKPYYS